jgi:hypothetical protein
MLPGENGETCGFDLCVVFSVILCDDTALSPPAPIRVSLLLFGVCFVGGKGGDCRVLRSHIPLSVFGPSL